jgi:hypothetical protein
MYSRPSYRYQHFEPTLTDDERYRYGERYNNKGVKIMRRTLLGVDLKTGEKIFLNDKERRAGMYVLGVQGRGKSSFLLNLIAQDLDKGYAVIVFDAHDDLIRHVIALLPPDRLSKTYLIDLDDVEFPIGLNLFACVDPTNELERAIVVERVLHIFERLWPDLRGILLEKLLRYITLTFLECPGNSLIDVRRLLWDDDFRENLVNSLTNEEVRAYWQHEYNMMTRSERRTETQAIENRLAPFLLTPFVRNIVCQRRNTLDFYRAIQEQEVLLIRLPMAGRQAHLPLIGTVMLAQIHAATFAFAHMNWNERPGYSLFADEFQHFATLDFAELFKEARKYGARITVAHQDRQNLAPEIRSATLTASTIASFQSTPADAKELAPLFFDSTERLRPEHIYPDPLRYLRLHEQPDIQDYYRQYVLSLQKRDGKQARAVMETLQDLLYQSVITRRINDRLFDTYTQQMFPLLHLAFDEPRRKQQQLLTTLHQEQQDIATLTAILESDQAFEDYLVIYYWHYIGYDYKRSLEWYFQPWVPEDYLLEDAEFWEKVLGKMPSSLTSLGYQRQERLQKAMDALHAEAAENNKLHHCDTLEKVLAEVRERTLTQRHYRLGRFWSAVARVHQLKSEYAIYPAIQHFHSQAFHRYNSTTVKSENDALFWQPVRSRKKNGAINESTRVDELVAEPLPLEAEASREQILAWLPNVARWGEEPPQSRVLAAWDEARWSYAEIRKLDLFLADNTAMLKDYYEHIGQYARNRGLWEYLNDEHVDNNVWQALNKELRRNALLEQMDTAEKLIQLRKHALQRRIARLTREAEAFRAALPSMQRETEEEIAAIEQRRSAFCAYMRHILELLIDDPGPLGERRIPKESDTVEKLLNLQKRQALVRVSGDVNQQSRKYKMKTPDVPQAAQPGEVERRLQQIPVQTRMKYGRSRSEVEHELRDYAEDVPGRGRKPGEDEKSPGPWYEE